jgi:hypothetical protein
MPRLFFFKLGCGSVSGWLCSLNHAYSQELLVNSALVICGAQITLPEHVELFEEANWQESTKTKKLAESWHFGPQVVLLETHLPRTRKDVHLQKNASELVSNTHLQRINSNSVPTE